MSEVNLLPSPTDIVLIRKKKKFLLNHIAFHVLQEIQLWYNLMGPMWSIIVDQKCHYVAHDYISFKCEFTTEFSIQYRGKVFVSGHTVRRQGRSIMHNNCNVQLIPYKRYQLMKSKFTHHCWKTIPDDLTQILNF